jgi:hypothetical protein
MPDPTTPQLLELERAHPRWTRSKHNAIAALGISEAVYFQRLYRVLATREALEHDAQLTHQLTDRTTNRAARRAALIRRRTP